MNRYTEKKMDDIIKEVHRVRDEIARKHGYDLKRICNDIKQRQAEAEAKGKKYACTPPKRVKKEAA